MLQCYNVLCNGFSSCSAGLRYWRRVVSRYGCGVIQCAGVQVLTAVGLLLVLLDEKCSITSQLDFLGAGVSAGEGEARCAAEGVLRPDSSCPRAGVAAERSDAHLRPRSASCVAKDLL